MRYAYQRGGAPILDWSNGPPRQSRAADSVALGSLGGGTTLDHPTLVLPAPGAPEVIGVTPGMAMGGCSCSGSCGCGPSAPGPVAAALNGIADAVPGGYLTLGVAAFLAWKYLKKRRR